MRILFVGDVHGRPGRRILAARLPALRRQHGADLVIANGENAAGGSGINAAVADELFAAGVDVITGGNHTWQIREAYELLDSDPRILRPANYPPGVPGRGSALVGTRAGRAVGVVNLMGRVFMGELDDPFRVARAEVDRLRERTPVIVVDFHAEATSEKQALAWYLDGQVSAVLGTHTHVQTADERILPGGTAYITDVGMTGPRDGIIGMDRSRILERFLTQLPVRFEVAGGPAQLNAVAVEVDEATGRARQILRVAEVESGDAD
ncbi:MAG: TIGR00282 family metallophosphoesterase [Armatimonadota bacterium]|nr:TIGR00282 family metallophosphoesterase [Armatimonadota bacterium]MDR7400723.1 TIGR00282 family metallophosphoesterase [Armatimonadota bacterium]MDR7436466.1 TIGR00282 family metallophosphoesterase [Armatimonadota bacterium]MDR7472501.1 TIGR00282 family metallophosphoesterase [Armatimonadota bacterium]MDR7506003.1 TIGR00282 family metallophosphoesterase [Armatimonadota bacterium]